LEEVPKVVSAHLAFEEVAEVKDASFGLADPIPVEDHTKDLSAAQEPWR
jgi:hypothetical protein